MNAHDQDKPGLKLSLVIPAYNEEKGILACLESVAKNSEGIAHEILVVNNASTDRTGELAASTPGVRVFLEEKRGTSAARQRGFEESTGDIVAFIDADSRMPGGWCKKVTDAFAKDDRLAALSGPYEYYDLPLPYRILIKAFWYAAMPVYFFTKHMALGGNIAMRRSVLEKMGASSLVKILGKQDSWITWSPSEHACDRFSPGEPHQGIDHVFLVSAGFWKIKSGGMRVETGALRPSDHCPVYADLAVTD